MLSPRIEWLMGMLGCCSGNAYEGHGEYHVSLSSDMIPQPPSQCDKHLLTRGDSFDITFTPRTFSSAGSTLPSRQVPITPRQREMRNQLELPALHTYPIPPNCSPEEREEERKRRLLEMYQEFALDLHTGMFLTQLTSNRDYSDIHCQLMEDMVTLKLDQSNGRIIEFPLTSVSKVYRIVKNDDKWYAAGSPLPGAGAGPTEQIVVVEFMRRKLAFVFKELQVSQRFLICMELLIRRAQQKQAVRSLTPTFPPPAQQQSRQCPTPRQVQEAMARPTPTFNTGPGATG